MKTPSTNENSLQGRLASINRSHGGVPKLPVDEALITESGVAGDRQRNLSVHGGPDRAVLIYSVELIQALVREGHTIQPGTTGENLTIAGLDWSRVVPGVELVIGEMRDQPATTDQDRQPVHLLVTTYAQPCSNIKASFVDGNSSRISPDRYPGWSRVYARVLNRGVIQVGDPVVLLEKP